MLKNNPRVSINYSPSGASSLYIERAYLDDAGSYQISATNEHGTSVYIADIEVERTLDFTLTIFCFVSLTGYYIIKILYTRLINFCPFCSLFLKLEIFKSIEPVVLLLNYMN